MPRSEAVTATIRKPLPEDSSTTTPTRRCGGSRCRPPRRSPRRTACSSATTPRLRPSTATRGRCASTETACAPRRPLSLSYADLRAAGHRAHHDPRVHRQRPFVLHRPAGQPVPGTPWRMGGVGAVTWEGVRLAEVLDRIGIRPTPSRCRPPAWTRPTSAGGIDCGPVRRPFPVAKALDDALLAWGINGEPLLPDHGYPVRLVLPGWVGIAQHQVARLPRGGHHRAGLAVDGRVVPHDRRRPTPPTPRH